MRADYGVFSNSTAEIRIRFPNTALYEHFIQLFRSPGVRIPPPKHVSQLEAIAIGTVLEHEHRHFHDFLLCHASLEQYWLKLKRFLLFRPLAAHLCESDTFNTIPVPVIDWATKSSVERATIVRDAKMWGGFEDISVWSPPVVQPSTDILDAETQSRLNQKLRTNPDEVLNEILPTLGKLNGSLRALRAGQASTGGLHITPRAVFEASATCVQLGSVWSTYGESEFVEFANSLLANSNGCIQKLIRVLMCVASIKDSSSANAYYENLQNGTIEEFSVIWRVQDIDWHRLGIMLTWAILGDRFGEPEMGCPAARLENLIHDHINGVSGVLTNESAAADVFLVWDTYYGVTPYKTVLHSKSKRFDQSLDKLTIASQKLSVTDEAASCVIRHAQGVFGSRSLLVERFIADPDDYVSPWIYASQLSRWPAGHVCLDVASRGFFSVKIDSESKNDRVTYIGTKTDSDGRTFADCMHFSGFFAAPALIDIDATLQLETLLACLDLLLDPQSLSPEDEQVFSELLRREHGKQLLFLPR